MFNKQSVFTGIIVTLIATHANGANLFTFQQALGLAYKNNPELQAEIDKAHVEKGNFAQSQRYPNPFVQLQAENIGGSGSYQGFESAETTLSIAQPIPLGHRLNFLKQSAYATYSATLAGINTKKVNLFTQVGLAYLDNYYAAQWYLVTQKLTDLNQDIVKEIKRRVSAGAGAQLDLNLAEVRLGEALIQQRKAALEIKVTRARLEQLMNSQITTEKKLTDFGLRHKPWSWKAISQQLNNSPVLREKRLRLQAQRAAIALVKKQVWPDLIVQVGARHFSDDGSNAAVLSSAAQVPVFDRNQGRIAAQEAQYTQIMHELKTLCLETKQTLYRLHLQAEQNQFEAEEVTKKLLPLARKAVENARDGYLRGRYGYLELSIAMNTLLEEEKHYLQAHADYHKAFIEIAGLLGSDDESK